MDELGWFFGKAWTAMALRPHIAPVFRYMALDRFDWAPGWAIVFHCMCQNCLDQSGTIELVMTPM